MIKRIISKKIKEYCKQYPVITITGPRQSGKTTLCKMLFPDRSYISLEDLDEQLYAKKDPRGFLSRFPDGVILDEVQKAPEILSYIQGIVDKSKKTGLFIITGSHNFELMNSVSQSLAGRTALINLLPFSIKEIYKNTVNLSIENVLYTGFYPRIFDKNLNPTEASSFYISTYVERDLRFLINIKDISRFTTFLKLCASYTGQIINYSNLGNDCGVKHNTIKSWLSILEASFIIKLLKPYYRNYKKRLIKAPKLYFLDTGLASYLLGIQSKDHLKNHPLKGALFETLIISEFLKDRLNQGMTDNLYYFRDSKGNEIDLLIDHNLTIDIGEIKLGKTVNQDFFKGINYMKKITSNINKAFIVYGGNESRFQNDLEIISWQDMNKKRIYT